MINKEGSAGGQTFLQETDAIEEVVKEYENQDGEDEEVPDNNNEDEEQDSAGNEFAEENGEDEDEDDLGMDNGLEEIDPQVLKL